MATDVTPLEYWCGISLEEYRALLKAQGGGCAICGAERSHCGQMLSVDHCHVTGVIRGLLCKACNSALSLFNEDPDVMRAAAEYLERGMIKEK